MKKKWQKILLIILGVLSISVIIGGFYLKSVTYTPTLQAQKAAESGEAVTGALKFQGDDKKPAVLFYQGALVEKASYSIWAEKLAAAGYTVYLIQEPLNLAVLSGNKAQQIIDQNKLTSYVIGGHSLGGVMASRFAEKHLSEKSLRGVFFLASYPDEKGSLATFKEPVLSLTGTDDGVLNQSAYQSAKKYLPKQTVFTSIEGGNHAGFGSYGEQKGDNEPKINNEEQQAIIADKLIQWLATVKVD